MDIQLVIFLHSCYFSIEATKKTIKNYYVWQAQQPDYFLKRNFKLDSALATSLETTVFAFLPKRTDNNEIVLIIRIINNDASLFSLQAIVKLYFMIMDALVLRYGTCNGLKIIVDCEPVTLSLVAKVQISTLKQLFFYLQEALPVRLKAIHFANSHAIFDLGYHLCKPFISPVLLERIFFHKTGSKTLLSHFPATMLSKMYGGVEKATIEELHENTKKLLHDFDGWFKENEAVRADLKLCPKEDKPKSSFFGSGLFKKLSFD